MITSSFKYMNTLPKRVFSENLVLVLDLIVLDFVKGQRFFIWAPSWTHLLELHASPYLFASIIFRLFFGILTFFISHLLIYAVSFITWTSC